MISREVVLHTLKCLPNQYPQVLEEKYPHILEKIVQLWNSRDAEAYFSDLLHPTFSGGRFDRQGFPKPVWQEILRLNELYRKPRPRK